MLDIAARATILPNLWAMSMTYRLSSYPLAIQYPVSYARSFSRLVVRARARAFSFPRFAFTTQWAEAQSTATGRSTTDARSRRHSFGIIPT